jgi:Rrf2 family protein
MLKLSKKVDYGLIALMHLARNGEGSSWSAREISETYDIPGGLLAKVLQKLGRAKLVASQHGTKGGYTLSRPAESIRALEVVEAIEGPVSLAQCFSVDGECVQFEKCNLKSPLQQLNDIVIRILSRVTIAQLAQEEFNTSELVAGEASGSTQTGSRSDLLPLTR